MAGKFDSLTSAQQTAVRWKAQQEFTGNLGKGRNYDAQEFSAFFTTVKERMAESGKVDQIVQEYKEKGEPAIDLRMPSTGISPRGREKDGDFHSSSVGGADAISSVGDVKGTDGQKYTVAVRGIGTEVKVLVTEEGQHASRLFEGSRLPDAVKSQVEKALLPGKDGRSVFTYAEAQETLGALLPQVYQEPKSREVR